LHFELFGFPVRVHPYFWLVTLLLGLNGSSTPPGQLVIWAALLFVSILVHELGHAVLQRHFGGRPWITLYAMGGLASCDTGDRQTRSQVLISLAGPIAGFLLALVVVVSVRLAGHPVGFLGPWTEPSLESVGLGQASLLSTPLVTIYWQSFDSSYGNYLVGNLLWVNILWGCVNLLPIYPLDGGQVARELCQVWRPRQGIVLSLQLSALCAGVMAVLGLMAGELFVAIFFGYFAYTSFQTFKAYQASAW